VTDTTTAEEPARKWNGFGEKVEGFDFLVMNEREVRASAGILFVFGFGGLVTAVTTSDFRLGQAFAIFFMFDMIIRLFISPKYSPSMALGRLAVYRQRPEWVSAKPKQVAWILGLALAMGTCFAMGRLGAPAEVVLAMCGTCVALLFLETAFGICVGCTLYRLFTRTKPEICPGDSCEYVPPARAVRAARRTHKHSAGHAGTERSS
jgi:hypothetical protein